ncbi:hypothetical protein K438DRAFT_1986945 [Mycena galopus ATCC 62051]|nr:hypothetical protein K438DRAFT_1994019 [Mycena galopus ATCC 62051]KAF8156186.1 hypothetical protein K438DRAFT_1986945 [Mycena galopus ATCC 62051]
MALSEKQRTHYGVMWLIAEERLAHEMVDIVQRVHAVRDALLDTRHPGPLRLKYDMHKFAMVNSPEGETADPADTAKGDSSMSPAASAPS